MLGTVAPRSDGRVDLKTENYTPEFENHGLWATQIGSAFACGCELSLGNPIDTSAVDVASNRSLPPTAQGSALG